jgi:glycosyltransferase involved in cell wall biosynthesis
MPARRIIHVITPGDHFSPRTGSAIPTVVDGLARAAGHHGAPRHAVVLDRSTYRPRYDSADEIEYVGVRGPGRIDRYLDAARGRSGLPRKAVARWFSPVAHALRLQPPSTLLAHNAPVVPWLLRDTPHTVVLYAHNDLLRTYSKREAGRMLGDAAAIVCVSDSLAEQMVDRLPREFADRVRVVGNGVDARQFSPRTASPDGIDRVAPLRIVFMGRVIPRKGADVLIRAAADLPDADAEILIIGRPGFAPDAPLSGYESDLRRLAATSAIPVRFEGFTARPELPDLLRTADVFVVPSRWPDPAPLTVGEALATGLPVVASRIGGIPELVGDAGVLVAPDDPGALAAALRTLLNDVDRRVELSTAARAQAEAHDWSWSWRQLDSLLARL